MRPVLRLCRPKAARAVAIRFTVFVRYDFFSAISELRTTECDSSIPSGNSMAVTALLTFGTLATGYQTLFTHSVFA